MSDAPEVLHEAAEGRYELHVGDEVAGFAEYEQRSDARAFMHTEVDDRFEGQGLGSELIREALEDTRGAGLAVLPYCPFVKGYIQRHAEYADLVPAAQRTRFGIPDGA